MRGGRQVWALAVAPKDDQRVATGGGDSVVNLWEDRTEELAEADTRANEARPLPLQPPRNRRRRRRRRRRRLQN